ncbi:hypothetical protein SCUP234_02003 [Seiridium cupressi]
MRSSLPLPFLLAISPLSSPVAALPFLRWAKRGPAPLTVVARASVSVVPIDGSGGGSDSTATTVVETVHTTVVQTSPPVTKTDTVVVTTAPTTEIVSTVSVIDIEPTTSVVTTTVTPTPSSTATTDHETTDLGHLDSVCNNQFKPKLSHECVRDYIALPDQMEHYFHNHILNVCRHPSDDTNPCIQHKFHIV